MFLFCKCNQQFPFHSIEVFLSTFCQSLFVKTVEVGLKTTTLQFIFYFILFFVPIFLLLPRQNIFSYIDYNVVLNQWRRTVNVREGNAGDIYTSIQKIIKVFPYVTTIAELLSTIPKIRNDFSTAKGGLFVPDNLKNLLYN